ncbi:hypothetical protein [Hazenella coriacea]|uniref:Uncharacterized protein n=1 Tax=Hazenella coriacea TaxID=1179467 RepID=A0A4V2UVT2_9BACL|nr:hypothetical protein [Hazenella coriacea]TCS97007.1 hypothetical protein EDD58_101654 [Hazenella coriacea]
MNQNPSPKELDEIQSMIEQLKQEEPELKQQLDFIQHQIDWPESFQPPSSSPSWFDQLGDWLTHSNSLIPNLISQLPLSIGVAAIMTGIICPALILWFL